MFARVTPNATRMKIKRIDLDLITKAACWKYKGLDLDLTNGCDFSSGESNLLMHNEIVRKLEFDNISLSNVHIYTRRTLPRSSSSSPLHIPCINIRGFRFFPKNEFASSSSEIPLRSSFFFYSILSIVFLPPSSIAWCSIDHEIAGSDLLVFMDRSMNRALLLLLLFVATNRSSSDRWEEEGFFFCLVLSLGFWFLFIWRWRDEKG